MSTVFGNGRPKINVSGAWKTAQLDSMVDKMESKPMARGNSIPAALRKSLQKAVAEVLKPTFFTQIPISDIDQALRANGCLLVQEDGTPWSGFLTGREGRAQLDIAPLANVQNNESFDQYVPFDNTVLLIMWYKMEQTGRYEVTGYIS